MSVSSGAPRRARERLLEYIDEAIAVAKAEQEAGMPPRGLIGSMVAARDEEGGR